MNSETNKFIKKCITYSLIELMKEKDFKEISITEIVKKAGVSRMAYYRNYNYKEDILNDHMIDLIEQYKLRRKDHEDSPYILFLFSFQFFKENKDFVISLEKSNLSVVIQNKINDYMKVFYPKYDFDTVQRYRLYIISGALYNSSKMWILNGLKESPEELAKVFVDKMFPIKK